MGKRTWITPYLETAQRYNWNPTLGQALKVLGRLTKKHSAAVVMDNWREYVHQTPLRYLSLKSFEEKFGAWSVRVVRERKINDQLDLQMKRKERRLSQRDTDTGGEPVRLDATAFLKQAKEQLR